MNTLSRTTKALFFLCFFSFFCNFNNISCQPKEASDEEVFAVLIVSYLDFQKRINSFEPNNTKDTAYCLDNTYMKDPSSINSIRSTIYPREDIDYYKVHFKNQRLALNHSTRFSLIPHFLLETDSTIVYDSRSPESANTIIESNQLIQIPFGNSEIIEERKVIIKDLDLVYLKIMHNENYSFPSGGVPYDIMLKNENPSITDNTSRGTFLFKGEFEPCPK